jgi:hypothetical protein
MELSEDEHHTHVEKVRIVTWLVVVRVMKSLVHLHCFISLEFEINVVVVILSATPPDKELIQSEKYDYLPYV